MVQMHAPKNSLHMHELTQSNCVTLFHVLDRWLMPENGYVFIGHMPLMLVPSDCHEDDATCLHGL